jgi:uncharacterized protein (DUF1800 family)
VDTASALPLVAALRDLGMPLYGAQPPTGYGDHADVWVNTGALLNRMNFAVAFSSGRLGRGGRAQASRPGADGHTLMAGALAGDVSDSTTSTVARAKTAEQAVSLVLGSPEFQKR